MVTGSYRSGLRLAALETMTNRTLNAWVLRATAAFALAWSIVRAVQQAITLDEADTYLMFAGQGARFVWYPFPNNHVFNTLLMWLSTRAFGVSPLTIRLPALIGAALYIAVACFLAQALTGRFALQMASLICLVYNPFILDYFAAARGYSLANAFLLAGLAIPVWHTRTRSKSVPLAGALASAAIGLSFASNFSFGLVDCAALLVIAIWAIRQRGPDSMLRVIGCCALPALVIAFGLCGYPITHYPRHSLWYGARSLGEMARSLADASLYRLRGPLKDTPAVNSLERYLLLALGALSAVQIILQSLNREFRRSLRAPITAALAGILMLTLAAHYLAFRLTKLPLPMSRTGIFFLPLCTLLIAVVAASPANSRPLRWLGHAITGLFLCLAVNCLLCLRHTYFWEYEWDADLESEVVWRNHRTAQSRVWRSGIYRGRIVSIAAELLPRRYQDGEISAAARLPGEDAFRQAGLHPARDLLRPVHQGRETGGRVPRGGNAGLRRGVTRRSGSAPAGYAVTGPASVERPILPPIPTAPREN